MRNVHTTAAPSYPSTFNDVIGPVMRGPSSSHCAAAVRVGRMARDLMNGDLTEVLVEFDSNGSLATTHDSQGSDMGLLGGGNNLLLLMPCVSMDNIATKLVTVFPGNRGRNRPVIDGLVILSGRSTGKVLALMDSKTITSMRTGAVTGVSIRHLSRADARSVGLVGCGVQGYYQLVYACTARDIRRITLFDIAPAAIPPTIEKLQTSLPGIEIAVAESTAALLKASDIVITATTARKPVFPDDPELFVGKHCVAIGSFEPDVHEYPDAVLSLVEKVWIDVDFAQKESGELIIPLRKGLLREEQLETLGHFIQSGRAPERGPYGTTLSKSVDMALFDLVAARLAFTSAIAKGLGTEL